MPDLLTYYKSLSRREKGVVNRKMYADGGLHPVTFSRKMTLKNFTPAEEIVISQILGIDRNELFPTIPAL